MRRLAIMTRAADYDGVLAGTRCFVVKFERADGFASIDPRFHAQPPDEGLVLYRGPGQNQTRLVCGDTTQLANGPHRVFLRTDAKGDSPGGIRGAACSRSHRDRQLSRGRFLARFRPPG